MSLNFQNKIVFPAPETSYTTQTAMGQVLYIPRNIMSLERNHIKKGKAVPARKSIVKTESVSTEPTQTTMDSIPFVESPTNKAGPDVIENQLSSLEVKEGEGEIDNSPESSK